MVVELGSPSYAVRLMVMCIWRTVTQAPTPGGRAIMSGKAKKATLDFLGKWQCTVTRPPKSFDMLEGLRLLKCDCVDWVLAIAYKYLYRLKSTAVRI